MDAVRANGPDQEPGSLDVDQHRLPRSSLGSGRSVSSAKGGSGKPVAGKIAKRGTLPAPKPGERQAKRDLGSKYRGVRQRPW